MAEFFNAVSAVFVIFLIMMVGYFLGHLGWLTASEKRFISLYVVNIAVPINCIVSVLGNFKREDLMGAGMMIVCSACVAASTLLVAALGAKLLGLPRNRWGVYVAMAGLPNTLFIGLPMIQQLFGDVGIPYMMAYYLTTSCFTQTAGVMLVEHAGGKSSGKKNILGIFADLMKKPPILGILAAVLMLVLDVRPPAVLMKAAGYISNSVTPLALIYCGFILFEVGLKHLRLLPGLGWMLLTRLIISPVICASFCVLFGLTGLHRDVFIVMAALPVVTQVTVMAGAYGADEEYAATGSSLSMLGVFITVPILMTIL